ncbi:hypothetical protein DL93DRAFT_1261881 [Clavulina sp. PMI_390]|nr:hypothetical protein DL93DRAFT_1261881 [Clavulina sp. PMI_390]
MVTGPLWSSVGPRREVWMGGWLDPIVLCGVAPSFWMRLDLSGHLSRESRGRVLCISVPGSRGTGRVPMHPRGWPAFALIYLCLRLPLRQPRVNPLMDRRDEAASRLELELGVWGFDPCLTPSTQSHPASPRGSCSSFYLWKSAGIFLVALTWM